LIILNFRPLQSGPEVLVRGAHFRICSDATLRGPDNTTAARYFEGLWYLGQRRHVSFECTGSLFLRVINEYGQRECTGPYSSIKAADGRIFAQDSCLGVHGVGAHFRADGLQVWQEVSILTSR